MDTAIFCNELLQEAFQRLLPRSSTDVALVSCLWCRLLLSSTSCLSVRFTPHYDTAAVASLCFLLALLALLLSLSVTVSGGGEVDALLLAVAAACPNLRLIRFLCLCVSPATFSAYGGHLLAMCSNDFICFYDWVECKLIRRIDVNVKNLYWVDSRDLVTIASDTSFYILKFSHNVVSAHLDSVVSAHLDSGRSADEQGVEDAFELLYEINERVRIGLWVGDCFIYNNSSWRLNYCVGGEVTTRFHLDRPMYLLGYLANQSRVYLINKEFKSG